MNAFELTNLAEVNEENYFGVKELLLSQDAGSVNVALSIMENANYETSQVYILGLIMQTFDQVYKKNGPYTEVWKEFPHLHANLKNTLGVGDDGKVETDPEKLVMLALERKNKTEIKFVLDNILCVLLKEALTEVGFEFLENVDLKLEIKEDEAG